MSPVNVSNLEGEPPGRLRVIAGKVGGSAALWLSVAFCLLGVGVIIGALNNHVVIDRLVSHANDSDFELRCRANYQIRLEIVTAQVTGAKARLDAAESKLVDELIARDPDVPNQRAVVTSLRADLEALDQPLAEAIADRSQAVEVCK